MGFTSSSLLADFVDAGVAGLGVFCDCFAFRALSVIFWCEG